MQVAALGKSGVSVGYFDTEDAAARAYDRAAIGLLGRQSCRAILNFPIEEYDHDSVPELVGEWLVAKRVTPSNPVVPGGGAV